MGLLKRLVKGRLTKKSVRVVRREYQRSGGSINEKVCERRAGVVECEECMRHPGV